jgi:predicted DNA-binding transcriptional regulator YafY
MPLLEIPAMGVTSAVTFDLVRAHLAHTLPRTTMKTLEPYFARARETLAAHAMTKLARWPAKVRVLPRAIRLHPPDVSARVLDVVYSALLEERRFKASYRTRHATREKEYVVNPIGLAVRDGSLTLVCTFWDYDDIHYILLHRMSGGELLDQPATRPKGFDLDQHLAASGLGFSHGNPIHLEALIDREVALTLHETPLGRDQKLTPRPSHRELLTVTVPNTIELRGWLQSYGPLIEVRKPKALRNEMAELAQRLVKRYA